MLHVWEYQDATGVTRRGVLRGYSDRAGSDVTYRFHRLGADGKPIRFDNGGRTVDLVNGSNLKAAKCVGGMTLEDYGYRLGD